jgi:transposase
MEPAEHPCMASSAAALPVCADDLAALRRWAGAAQAPAVLVQRAKILLLAAEGVASTEIAERLGIPRPTVIAWRKRYAHDGLTGRLTDACQPRHRHNEFLDFLKLVAKAYPRRQLHVVVDNYATHKYQRVQAWLASHPRVRLHFTPTYASWLNLVEVFFAIIQRQALRRGDFASIDELVAAIRRFCDGWNQRCHPFTWTQDADQILAKLNR